MITKIVCAFIGAVIMLVAIMVIACCKINGDAIDIVIEALEKQIPKKPVNYDSVPHSRCPVCNNAVKVFEDAHEYHYCLYCGQCLDWSDEK